mgnify:CR=1 FL=1
MNILNNRKIYAIYKNTIQRFSDGITLQGWLIVQAVTDYDEAIEYMHLHSGEFKIEEKSIDDCWKDLLSEFEIKDRENFNQ